jgi:hypothetical protein
VALIWAFLKPSATVWTGGPVHTGPRPVNGPQADALQVPVPPLDGRKEDRS